MIVIAECPLSLESRRSNTIKANVRYILKADVQPLNNLLYLLQLDG